MAAAKTRPVGISGELLDQLQGLLVQHPSLMGQIRGFDEWSDDLVKEVDRTLLQYVPESILTAHKTDLDYNKRVVVRVYREYILNPREECAGFTLPQSAVRFRRNPPQNLSRLNSDQITKLLYRCRDIAFDMQNARASCYTTGGWEYTNAYQY